jgi:germacradienol/geosmin synthase
MPAYNLPEFYAPYPARINPHVERARAHSKAWARSMQMIDSAELPAWTERQFGRYDFALFTSYVHPDTTAELLEELTDWYVWLFYFDDHFVERFKRTGDLVAAREYLGRLPLFMPPDGVITAEPENPVEAGLADVWTRTIPARSMSWRRRFGAVTRNTLDEALWELANINAGRVADPVEYIEMRRKVGGGVWAATMVEHATGAEVPWAVACTRPMRVLSDTFADAVHLLNDLVSYDREVNEEGELSNAVLVFERFLSWSPQRAADLVNDLLTSRLQQFEHTALTETSALFYEHGLDPGQQLSVAVYVKSLQDWLGGNHEYHMRSPRYAAAQPGRVFSQGPTGIGTQAARIAHSLAATMPRRLRSYTHIPFQPASAIRPPIAMPFSLRLNPHLGGARENVIAWAAAHGLLAEGIWDEARLRAFDFALFTAGFDPDADPDQLDLGTAWMTWANYGGGAYPFVYDSGTGIVRGAGIVAAKAANARLALFMPADPAAMPEPVTAMERGLADLWRRAAPGLSTAAQDAFRGCVTAMLASWVWELGNMAQNRIPDPVDHAEMRRATHGTDFALCMLRLGHEECMPDDPVLAHPVEVMEHAAQDCAWLINDLFSYRKEIEFDGDPHNLVLVAQNFLGCDPQIAMDLTARLLAARVRRFQHAVTAELPALRQTLDLDEPSYHVLRAHTRRMECWLASTLHWHQNCHRYGELDLIANRRPALSRIS